MTPLPGLVASGSRISCVASTIWRVRFKVVNSGAGWPFVGVIVSVNGNRPLLAALNDRVKDAP